MVIETNFGKAKQGSHTDLFQGVGTTVPNGL
jgi:hypothetical protein